MSPQDFVDSAICDADDLMRELPEEGMLYKLLSAAVLTMRVWLMSGGTAVPLTLAIESAEAIKGHRIDAEEH